MIGNQFRLQHGRNNFCALAEIYVKRRFKFRCSIFSVLLAIGCPDFKAPPHTWQDKENDSLVIGCMSSDKTWKLLCVNNMWLGRVGNCTPRKLQLKQLFHSTMVLYVLHSIFGKPFLSFNYFY